MAELSSYLKLPNYKAPAFLLINEYSYSLMRFNEIIRTKLTCFPNIFWKRSAVGDHDRPRIVQFLY